MTKDARVSWLKEKLDDTQRGLDRASLGELESMLYIAIYRHETLKDMIVKTIDERREELSGG